MTKKGNIEQRDGAETRNDEREGVDSKDSAVPHNDEREGVDSKDGAVLNNDEREGVDSRDCFVPRNDNKPSLRGGTKNVIAREARPRQSVESVSQTNRLPRSARNDDTKQPTALIPQLRFKEFDGEWEVLKLSEVAKIERGRFSPRPRNNPIYYNGDIPFVQTSDVVNANGKIDVYTQTLNEKGLAVSKLFPAGTILITIAANIGHVGVLQIDMACPDSLIGIKPNANTHNYFLNYYLATHQLKMDYLAPEGAQKNINIEFLNPYKIPSTSLPEQQKIATFLSAVDKKIQQLSKKKALLEAYKKGVMQQLFSGQLRFKPDPTNETSLRGTKQKQSLQNEAAFPDWEEKRLGELGELKNGLNKDKKDFGFGSPFVNLMDVFGKYEIRNQNFDLVNSNEKEKKLYSLLRGDVLFIRSSVKRTGVGEAVIIQEDLPDTVYSGFLIRFRENKKQLFQDYKKYCFTSNDFRKELLSYATSSANTNINQESLNKIRVVLPSIEEQQKIASYLSSIDTKIETVSQQISQTQRFKKGLLQQLFV